MAEQRDPVVRKVALKIIKLGMDTKQVVGRFEAERQALALMEHPNIAKIIDGGSTDTGRPYFVMELVQGRPITEFCDHKKLSTSDRLSLFMEVCDGIQHAHQKGIIHRDLKPSNILVTLNGDKAVPKIIDFGIAKATQQRLTEKTVFTRFQQFVGTPAYMSPEQADMSEQDIDTRSDIYSLGVLLYELLTGRTPFETKDLVNAGYEGVRRILREDDPPKPSTRLSDLTAEQLTTAANHRQSEPNKLGDLIRGELDWIVMKALDKDRARRYETANGFALVVRRYLNDEPVTAVAPSAAYRFQKFARRNKAALATVTAFALLLIAGIISTEIEARHAKERREEARFLGYVADSGAVHKIMLDAPHENHWALEMLKAYVPMSEDEEDFRGWEWRYLWDQADLQTRLPLGSYILQGHKRMTDPASFSPNGRLLVSRSRDGYAIVWGTESGKLLHRLPHDHWVLDADFSRDSRLVVTTSGDVMKLWDISSNDHRTSKTIRLAPGESAGIVQFSPSQDLLAYAAAAAANETDSRVILCNYTHDEVSLTLTNAGEWFDFSPDGDLLITHAAGGERPAAKFWDLRADGALICTRTNFPKKLSFGGRGEDIVTSESDGVRIYTLSEILNLDGDQSRDLAPRIYGQGFGTIHGGWTSPDGRFLVFQADRNGYLIDLLGDLNAMKIPGGKPCFSSDGQKIAFRTSRTNLIITSSKFSLSTNSIPDVFGRVEFSPKGRYLTFKRRGRSIELFDPSDMKPVRVLDQVPVDVVPYAYAPSGDTLIGGVWDIDTGRLVRIDVSRGTVEQAKDFERPFHRVSYSPDGRLLALLFSDAMLSILDVENLGVLRAFKIADKLGKGFDLEFSPNGKWLVVGDHWNLTLYDTTTWDNELIPDQLSIIGFVGRESKLLSWSTFGSVFETNLETKKTTERFETWGTQVGFSVSPDERTLATGDFFAGFARLWNLRTGRELISFDLEGTVRRVQFSPDGKTLLSWAIASERAPSDWYGTLHYWKAPSLEEVEIN